MAEIQTTSWSENPAENSQSPPDGWPEGMPRSAVNDAAREMMAAIKRAWNRSNPTIASTGSGAPGSAYVLTYQQPPAAYVRGLTFRFWAHALSLDKPTLNVNGLGAKPLKYIVGIAAKDVMTGDIRPNSVVEAVYNPDLDAFICVGLRAGDDFYVLRSSPVITDTLTQNLLTIGNTLGANRVFSRQRASSASNTEYLEWIANRFLAGSDWKGVEFVLRRLVDTTETHSVRLRGDGKLQLSGTSGIDLLTPVTMPDGGSFAAGRSSISAYQALPGGVIIQAASAVGTGDGSGNYNVTFPIAFPNVCVSAVPQNGDTSQGANSSVVVVSWTRFGFLAHFTGPVGSPFRTNFVAMGW